MPYEVIIQPRAERDIDAATKWIADRSPEAASRWFSGLIEAIDTLERFPERCALAPESDAFEFEIRQLLYGKKGRAYRILFTVLEDQVRILHFRHWAQRHLSPDEIRSPESSSEPE